MAQKREEDRLELGQHLKHYPQPLPPPLPLPNPRLRCTACNAIGHSNANTPLCVLAPTCANCGERGHSSSHSARCAQQNVHPYLRPPALLPRAVRDVAGSVHSVVRTRKCGLRGLLRHERLSEALEQFVRDTSLILEKTTEFIYCFLDHETELAVGQNAWTSNNLPEEMRAAFFNLGNGVLLGDYASRETRLLREVRNHSPSAPWRLRVLQRMQLFYTEVYSHVATEPIPPLAEHFGEIKAARFEEHGRCADTALTGHLYLAVQRFVANSLVENFGASAQVAKSHARWAMTLYEGKVPPRFEVGSFNDPFD